MYLDTGGTSMYVLGRLDWTGGNVRSAKGSHHSGEDPLFQRRVGVSEDVERAEEDYKVYGPVPTLRGEYEPGVVVDAPRSGDTKCLLDLEGDAVKRA